MLAIGRLVSGFPHGAFFWRRSDRVIVAHQTRKVTAAVAGWFPDDSRQFAGHSAGNVFKSEFSWRYTFLLIKLL